MEGDVIAMQDIFVFERTGMTPAGQGHRPLPRDGHPPEGRSERIVASGIQLPAQLFEHVQEVQ